MFTQPQRTLPFTCDVSVLTQEKHFKFFIHSFIPPLNYLLIRCLLRPYYVQNTLKCQGFLSKTKIWSDTALLLSVTSHCKLQTAGHAHHVLAHLHVSVHPVSLSGSSILVVQMKWNVPSSLKLPPDLSWFPSPPYAGILLFPQCLHSALYQLLLSLSPFNLVPCFCSCLSR